MAMIERMADKLGGFLPPAEFAGTTLAPEDI